MRKPKEQPWEFMGRMMDLQAGSTSTLNAHGHPMTESHGHGGCIDINDPGPCDCLCHRDPPIIETRAGQEAQPPLVLPNVAKLAQADSGDAWAHADAQVALAMRLSRSLLHEKLSRLLRGRLDALWLSQSDEPTPIYDEVMLWYSRTVLTRQPFTLPMWPDDPAPEVPPNVIRIQGATTIDIRL